MGKVRLKLFLLTLLVVATLGSAVFLYARGYRFSPNTKRLAANGLFVAKSNPDGAQLYLNGELETATNATINLEPGTYDVEVKKDGYHTWNKRLLIEKEIVTEITANLFKTAPSLVPLTFYSAHNPVSAPGFSKIVYFVPATIENVQNDKEGLWVIETLNWPIGFNQEPKRITDGDLSLASYYFSPNGRELLVLSASSVFLLETSTFTPQTARINIASTVDQILEEWELERQAKLTARLKRLPDELVEILNTSAENITFSPDDEKILYLATKNATIKDNLIPQLPGSSTQNQERSLTIGHIYVYDIKEDRNFEVGSQEKIAAECVTNQELLYLTCESTISWYPTSLNLLLAHPEALTILDYDGTNRKDIYTGAFTAPFAYPTNSADRIIFLTNLGSNSTDANLYSLTVK